MSYQTQTAALPAREAFIYAAQWGSAMTAGDPGACMYGFDERFRVQSEAHRAACLAWISRCRAAVTAKPADYSPDELERLDRLTATVRVARVEGDPIPAALPPRASVQTPTAAEPDGFYEFAAGYLQCAIFCAPEDTDDEAGAMDCDPGELTDEAHAAVRAHALEWFTAHAALIREAAERPGYSLERAGHDLHFTENGHGVGFWDRRELEADGLGDRLTKAAGYADTSLYRGDDGRVHFGGSTRRARS